MRTLVHNRIRSDPFPQPVLPHHRRLQFASFLSPQRFIQFLLMSPTYTIPFILHTSSPLLALFNQSFHTQNHTLLVLGRFGRVVGSGIVVRVHDEFLRLANLGSDEVFLYNGSRLPVT